nr:MAG TPA: hypothetical protein [Caudoviricetes sp.]
MKTVTFRLFGRILWPLLFLGFGHLATFIWPES